MSKNHQKTKHPHIGPKSSLPNKVPLTSTLFDILIVLQLSILTLKSSQSKKYNSCQKNDDDQGKIINVDKQY